MNKHDYKERPHIDDVWNSFDFKVVMCGMGDDTAMLIAELYDRGMEPDELVFCDTGSEFPHTYKFIKDLEKWSNEKKWSKVVILKKLDRFDKPLSVISLCQSQNTLPAVAFGSKSCSLRFKVETADKYFNNHFKCWSAWDSRKKVINITTGEYEMVLAKGAPIKTHKGKILRMVGFNADEPKRVKGWRNEPKWTQLFPLFDWGIGEFESKVVDKVGLYYPGKSSCFICPNMTHPEIAMLRDDYPKLYQIALGIEKSYRHKYLVKSKTYDLFGDDSFDNTTLGLGGLNGKTWEQMLKEYDDNPRRYKRMSDNKPCECGH